MLTPASEPAELPVQWDCGRKLGEGGEHAADHSHAFSAEIKTDGAGLPLPDTSSLRSAERIRDVENFTFDLAGKILELGTMGPCFEPTLICLRGAHVTPHDVTH